jgi:hypothetical protein
MNSSGLRISEIKNIYLCSLSLLMLTMCELSIFINGTTTHMSVRGAKIIKKNTKSCHRSFLATLSK